MNGFHAQNRFHVASLTAVPSFAIKLICIGVVLSLSFSSGCSLVRNAKSGLHQATCGETEAHCKCTCSECLAGGRIGLETGHHNQQQIENRAAAQVYPVSPPNPEGSRPLGDELGPMPAMLDGKLGTFTPSPPASAQFEFRDQNVPSADNAAVARSLAAEPENSRPYYSGMQQQPQVNRQPEVEPRNDAPNEIRTQMQIMTEQISQLKNAQNTFQQSQETLQKAHQQEILEFKLQQANERNERLTRERELELEVERQRRREREAYDRMQQIMTGADPASEIPSAALAPVPQSLNKARQVKSSQPQNLPTVDENY